MSEKRKPEYIILLGKLGKKKIKIELFNAELWGYESHQYGTANRYRIRINGKWYPSGGKVFFSKWEFRDRLFRSIGI